MKLHRIILLLSFLLFILNAYGQESTPKKDKPKRGYLAFSIGPALTIGDFGSTTWDNDRAGFAKTGIQYTIAEFGFKFVPNFGLSAAIKGAVIPVNVQKLADGYAEQYGGQFKVESTRWGYTGFFVGPFACIPTKHVDIDFRFMPGLLFAVSPEMNLYWDGVKEYSQYATLGTSFAFNIGAGARVHLSKKFSVLAQADYHFSRPTFQVEYDNYNNNGVQSDLFGQQITTFNFSLGVGLRIF